MKEERSSLKMVMLKSAVANGWKHIRTIAADGNTGAGSPTHLRVSNARNIVVGVGYINDSKRRKTRTHKQKTPLKQRRLEWGTRFLYFTRRNCARQGRVQSRNIEPIQTYTALCAAPRMSDHVAHLGQHAGKLHGV